MITKDEERKIWNMPEFYSSAKLLCDGHQITLSNRTYNRRINTMVWIEGKMKGIDMMKDSELGAKFYRPRYTYPRKGKLYTNLCKAVGKREADKALPAKALVSYDPTFSTPRAALNHFKKTCKEIKLISCD